MEEKSLWSSQRWRETFTNNYEGATLLKCDALVTLSNNERKAITKSIQAFQLGENSEGKHLYLRAREYAEKTGDFEYVKAIKLFISEEQRHSHYLARFMNLAGIPLTRKTFIDGVFRNLRQLAGLECSIIVLITAEIIAKVYYRALHDATSSEFLKAICNQILRDEKMHVQFQAERLAILRRARKGYLLLATKFIQRFLFAGTMFVVWLKCRQTLRAGGYSFTSWCIAAWSELNLTMDLMDFRKYRAAQLSVATSS